MTPAVLHGLLWLARSAFRAGNLPVQAAHGYADPAYRPPQLPFVSVVGPLMVGWDPQREAARPREANLQLPGHLMGTARPAAQTVTPGPLRLRFDGEAEATIAVAVGAFDPEAAGRAVAGQIETSLRQAAAAGTFTTPEGVPIANTPDNAGRIAELSAITCRWDALSRRLAVSSGRRGVATSLQRSSVELLPLAAATASDLGLGGGRTVEGRVRRHKLNPPRAMTVDVRFELWAASQAQLAAMADVLGRVALARTSFITAPALLALDALPGDDKLKLLPVGEPLQQASLIYLEAADGPRDRVSGRTFSVPPGAPLAAGPARFHLSGNEVMAVDVSPTPLIPDPRETDNPIPRGVALTVGLMTDAGATAGQQVRVASLDLGAQTALRLELQFVDVGGRLFADIVGTATFVEGASTATASTTWRVPAAAAAPSVSAPFETGTVIHAAVNGSRRAVDLFLDGRPRPDSATPPPTAATLGRPLGGNDMRLLLGNPTGGGNPLSLSITHAHLFSEPIGPIDPQLRGSITPARGFVPGQRVRLTRIDQDIAQEDEHAETTVVAVNGDELTIFPTVEDRWERGRTILFADQFYFQPLELRRRDDLLNQVYRLTADYRVSALLEEDVTDTSVPMAEQAEVNLDTRRSGRPQNGVPGVTATLS